MYTYISFSNILNHIVRHKQNEYIWSNKFQAISSEKLKKNWFTSFVLVWDSFDKLLYV